MAKKIPPKDPETGKFVKSDIQSADEAIAEEKQRIADEQTSEFLGEDVKNNKVVEDDPEPPAKEELPPKEDIKKERVEVDPEKLKQEITEKVSKETVEKIAKALTGDEKATQAQKDKYEEYAEKFLAEKGRNPTWFELVPFIRDEVKAELRAEADKAENEKIEKQKLTEKENKERTKTFNAYVDEQLKELYDSGRLPKTDEARKHLFKTMMEVNQKRASEGKQPIYSVKEIFYEHYKAPNAQPAGWNAPVSVGRGAPSGNDEQDYSYKDIAGKKSFLDILMGK